MSDMIRGIIESHSLAALLPDILNLGESSLIPSIEFGVNTRNIQLGAIAQSIELKRVFWKRDFRLFQFLGLGYMNGAKLARSWAEYPIFWVAGWFSQIGSIYNRVTVITWRSKEQQNCSKNRPETLRVEFIQYICCGVTKLKKFTCTTLIKMV